MHSHLSGRRLSSCFFSISCPAPCWFHTSAAPSLHHPPLIIPQLNLNHLSELHFSSGPPLAPPAPPNCVHLRTSFLGSLCWALLAPIVAPSPALCPAVLVDNCPPSTKPRRATHDLRSSVVHSGRRCVAGTWHRVGAEQTFAGQMEDALSLASELPRPGHWSSA